MPYRKWVPLAAAAAALGALAAPQAAYTVPRPDGLRLDGVGACDFPMKEQFEGRPWPLQRVLLDELWQDTRGKGIRVAVIDTGVDDTNPQLRDAVDTSAGIDYTGGGGSDGTVDEVGHGTKVAGIIAARPRTGTGFVGLAPEATVIPIRQNDGRRNGLDSAMAAAIDHAIAKGAQVINISQDTTRPLADDSLLGRAVARAVAEDVVVVAAAGNDGMDGRRRTTYPAGFDGVLAVAASDRNNERAPFSQAGEFVGIAAPGVDIVSTVPGDGQCTDNGTSFAAPYVAGVVALMRAKYPDWTAAQIIARIEQTAERSVNGRDAFVGWGVVDPVRALSGDDAPQDAPHPDAPAAGARAPEPARLTMSETSRQRSKRYATYALASAAVLVGVVAGAATVARDLRRRRVQRHR
ncbi:type VII secretion-associated serine protease mycosin [Streptomyces poriferorum]|uniref:Type VII secretion-associated serine protease mycosin n=1 Tax=Streptomyces poriferorum TaxID=2798799 RepID=A0ABY9IMB8_9ACTN|nr:MULTISPECIES: type VII secretion-associated serine protease mycosin [unclassified Streptomyces]MDP5315142.1 type VII secretion-associated serine protease mycosin [Streptomyces sp. Alt4]WLQ55989.1 type VII secretion-associated serine protease mycosin [Streptomyces sp. Alt2]